MGQFSTSGAPARAIGAARREAMNAAANGAAAEDAILAAIPHSAGHGSPDRATRPARRALSCR
jgi:hypothetical protein